MYLAFLERTRIAGQRALAAGVLGLLTLFALRVGFGRLRRRPWVDALVDTLPMLVMAEGRVRISSCQAGVCW